MGPVDQSHVLENVIFLLVDPNDFMRKLVLTVLKAFGARRLYEATNIDDAFIIAKRFRPDIILTEWSMHPLDGVDLTRWLRTHDESPNPFVPIIMVTAYNEYGHVLTARDAGVTEYVIKPLSAKTLMARVQEVILRPRTFVKVPTYFGPDRRRRRKGDFKGQDKRGLGMPPGAKPVDLTRRLTQEEADRTIAGEDIGGGPDTTVERKTPEAEQS